MKEEFWSVNFLGLLGSITGAIALLVSVISYRYNKPSVVIDPPSLHLPPFKSLANRSRVELENTFLRWQLDLWVRNTRGGTGSVEKPTLVIKFPKIHLFSKRREIKLEPRIQDVARHTIERREGRTSWEEVPILDARHFNLQGGSSMHELLEYILSDAPNAIHDLIENSKKLEYFAVYRDNRGESKVIKVAGIIET